MVGCGGFGTKLNALLHTQIKIFHEKGTHILCQIFFVSLRHKVLHELALKKCLGELVSASD